ncbi:histidine phosphatase family protein [Zafaria cholistanensis]|nr:histidine phosphatase family protein [Zafaria cholistanensis]
MQARIALVRHGETDWNAQGRLQGSRDIPLNDAGRSQARQAGVALGRGRWDLLVSSTLQRAAESADIIGALIGLEATHRLPDLVERSYGAAEGHIVQGLSRPQVEALLATGEPEASVAARGVGAIGRLVSEYPGRRIVVVAHGTLIRLTLDAVLGGNHPHVENGQVLELDWDARAWVAPVRASLPGQ